jgi:hypothetical protein
MDGKKLKHTPLFDRLPLELQSIKCGGYKHEIKNMLITEELRK